MDDLVRVEAGKGGARYWKDAWLFRDLLFYLSVRDVLVRYKQTAIGVLWAVVRPFMILVVFSIVFGRLAGLSAESGVPYPVMVYSGMLAWQFFAQSFTEITNSMVANANMVTKVYFPRILIPASAVLVNLVDLTVSFFVFALVMAWYGFVPSWRIVLLPVFLVFAMILALGAGLILCALNVKYRDFKYLAPFVVQFGLYISPVGFSAAVVPEKWRLLYSLNPMVGIINGCRYAVTGAGDPFGFPGIAISAVLTLILFFLGIRFFRTMERGFADTI